MSHCGETAHEFPPGSKEARERGCCCPVLDNKYGKGYMGIKSVYVTTSLCAMHWNAWNAEPPEPSKTWTCCAGCGGAAAPGELEDVSLLVGSGAEEPRRLVWEHPLCGLCLRMLLSQSMSKYCPVGCREEHGQDAPEDGFQPDAGTEIAILAQQVKQLVDQLNLDDETFEAVFFGVLGFHLGARDPSLKEERELYGFFKRWREANDLE